LDGFKFELQGDLQCGGFGNSRERSRKLFGWGHVKGKFGGKLPRKNIWCQINSRARNQSNNHSKYSNLNAYDVF
jgi:hypothetical protein